NTFINAPLHLRPTLQWRRRDTLFFAGQMTGVEGYIESAATGLLAGINAAHDHGAGRAARLHHRSGAQTVSADERQLRPDRAAGGAAPGPGEKGNDGAPRARRSRRVETRARRGAGRKPIAGTRMSPRRSAFIDIGTNTILCLIAEIRDTGRFRILDDLADIAGL